MPTKKKIISNALTALDKATNMHCLDETFTHIRLLDYVELNDDQRRQVNKWETIVVLCNDMLDKVAAEMKKELE